MPQLLLNIPGFVLVFFRVAGLMMAAPLFGGCGGGVVEAPWLNGVPGAFRSFLPGGVGKGWAGVCGVDGVTTPAGC